MSEPPTAHAEALKRLKERKELADAEREALSAEQSTTAARLAVPPSGVAGTVTLGEQAGAMETALLTGHALKRAARLVATAVLEALPRMDATTVGATAPQLLVVPAGEMPDSLAIAARYTERDLLLETLVREIGHGASAVKRIGNAPSSSERDTSDSASGTDSTPSDPGTDNVRSVTGLESIPAIGAGLQAAAALLSYFKSDYTIAGRAVATDDALLARAVAGAILARACRCAPDVHLPCAFDVTHVVQLGTRINDFTKSIGFQRDKAMQSCDAMAQELDRLASAEQSIPADATDADARRADIAARRAVVTRAHERLKAVVEAADRWLAAPFGDGEAGALALREWMLWDRMRSESPGAHILVVKTEQAGGSSITVKNLWTAFGRLPYYLSAGVVVSYQLFDGATGALRASDVFPVHGGFISPRDLSWRAP